MFRLLLQNSVIRPFSILFIFLSLCTNSFSYDFEGGTGEPNNPYQIATSAQLLQIGSDPNLLNKCYILLNDIDLDPNVTGIPPFTQAPIAPDTIPSSSGFQGAAFTGIFDGNDKKIRNLKIDTAGAGNDYLGLFGHIGIYESSVQVKNLGIEDTIIRGGTDSDYLGGLCGRNNSGTIINCYSTGSVSGDFYLGGLCGGNYYGTIINCYANGSVSGDYHIGSLCGESYYGMISNCYSSGQVTGGTDSAFLGGLCGYNFRSTIINCYVTGSVTGDDYLGGLCGGNRYGTISNCYSSGQVTGGPHSYYLGGLFGENRNGIIINCYFYLFSGPDNNIATYLESGQMIEQASFPGFDFAGNPEDGNDDYWSITPGHCPKLSWQTDDGPLPPSYFPDTNLPGSGIADDPFQINNDTDFAEFITNSQLNCGYYVLTYDVNLSSQSFTTSIIDQLFGGHLDGTGHRIDNITIDTLGAENDDLGMFGRVSGSIRNLGIENISITAGTNSDYLGGLCGINYGTISNCYINGSVAGEASSWYLGGLCGANVGPIINCYSSAQVTGGNDSYSLGGLCGGNSGTIINCYATGSVSGSALVSGSIDLGGLCGQNAYGTIINCYATGFVSGYQHKGGFCGSSINGSFTGCFWDVNVSDINDGVGNLDPDPNGVYGRTTDQMQTLTTFTDYDWDFVGEADNGTEDIWRMCIDGISYPKLFWEFTSGDLICPDGVDFLDFAFFADYWLNSDCASLNNCSRTDFDLSGSVDANDLNIFTSHWLQN